MVRIVNGEVWSKNELSGRSIPNSPAFQPHSSNGSSHAPSATSGSASASDEAFPHMQPLHLPPPHPTTSRHHDGMTSHALATTSQSTQWRGSAIHHPSTLSGVMPPSYSPISPTSPSNAASHINPYLVPYGGPALTSGMGLHAPTHQHQQPPHQLDAHAMAVALYPYLAQFQGFLGTGFILGHGQAHNSTPSPSPPPSSTTSAAETNPAIHAQQESTTQSTSPLPLSSTSMTSSALAPSLSQPSSSCSSPLLAATSARRRSHQPHHPHIPPTHINVAANGLVLPVQALSAAAAAQREAEKLNSKQQKNQQQHQQSSVQRVVSAFNLFGLPSIYVYEIEVPPHVYLLTALILYLIGPPALIPLVAFFFLYRFQLQRQQSAASRMRQQATSATTLPSSTLNGNSRVGHSTMGHHPSGMQSPRAGGAATMGGVSHKPPPSPLITPIKRNPNIHSLFD